MSTQVDHLVIAADSLEQGRAWCEQTLGVAPSVGGRHALMGTHNLLLNVSSATYERAYLEIIAVDPDAAALGRPRWFGLDARRAGPPSLAQVVVRSRTLDMHRWGLMHHGVNPGAMVSLERGELRWQMLLNDQAAMPGALPMLIQWGERHPADALPDVGIRLMSVTLDGIPAAQARVLGMGRVGGHEHAAPCRTVRFDTPLGPLELSADASLQG